MSPIELRQVALVAAMARLRSQKAAAEALNISQTAASRRLRALEDSLGVELFRRGWDGAELTHAGEALAREFTLILLALEETGAELFAGRSSAPALWASLKLRDLEAVRATVANGSVSGAAAALGKTQPEISRSIAQIDDHLGLPLFRRRRTGMEPLAAATRLARLSDELDALFDRALRNLQEMQNQIFGRVAVGLLPFSEQTYVMRVFAQLTTRYPRLRLIAMPGSYASLVEALRRGEIDCVIGVCRGDTAAPDLLEEPLFEETFVIIGNRNHPLAELSGALPPLIPRFAKTSWVIAPHGTPIRSYFERLFENSDIAPPAHSCEILSFSSAEQMLAESSSLGMLSYSCRALQALRPDLRALAIQLPQPTVQIGATRLARVDLNPAASEFIALFRAIVDEEARVCA